MEMLFYPITLFVFCGIFATGTYVVSQNHPKEIRLFILPFTGFLLWMGSYLFPLVAPFLSISSSPAQGMLSSGMQIGSLLSALVMTLGLMVFVGEYPISRLTVKQKRITTFIGVVLILVITFLMLRTDIIVYQNNSLSSLELNVGSGFGILTTLVTISYGVIFALLGNSLFRTSNTKQKNIAGLLLIIVFSGFLTPYISMHIIPLLSGSVEFTWWGLSGPFLGAIIFIYSLFTQQLFDLKITGINLILFGMAVLLMGITVTSNSGIAFVFNLFILVIFGILAFFLIYEFLLEKRRKEKIESANTRLSEMIDAKENFLRLTSYQLKTPLSGIQEYLNLLLKSPAEEYGYPQEVRPYLEKAYINYQRLNAIVEDISIANKISTGHWKLHLNQNLNLLDIINQTIEYNQFLSQEYEVSVQKNMPSHISALTGNENLLFKAINNIVRNGIIYGDTSLEVQITERNDEVIIQITDDGMGITPEEIETVYQRFRRAQRAEQKHPDGSGIGLYIARAIIEKHEGSLKVSSDGRGEGTNVTITLPLNGPNE